MNFGDAIERVKKGEGARRKAWKGKTFVFINHGSRPAELHGRTRIAAAIADDLFELGDKKTAQRLPNLNLAASDGSTVTGWTPSQVDMLSDDWEIV